MLFIKTVLRFVFFGSLISQPRAQAIAIGLRVLEGEKKNSPGKLRRAKLEGILKPYYF